MVTSCYLILSFLLILVARLIPSDYTVCSNQSSTNGRMDGWTVVVITLLMVAQCVPVWLTMQQIDRQIIYSVQYMHGMDFVHTSVAIITTYVSICVCVCVQYAIRPSYQLSSVCTLKLLIRLLSGVLSTSSAVSE